MTQNENNNSIDTDQREPVSIFGSIEVFVGGFAIAGSLIGADTFEAETPADALGSVNLGDKSVFVTEADLGFALLAAAGVAIIGHGIRNLSRSR